MLQRVLSKIALSFLLLQLLIPFLGIPSIIPLVQAASSCALHIENASWNFYYGGGGGNFGIFNKSGNDLGTTATTVPIGEVTVVLENVNFDITNIPNNFSLTTIVHQTPTGNNEDGLYTHTFVNTVAIPGYNGNIQTNLTVTTGKTDGIQTGTKEGVDISTITVNDVPEITASSGFCSSVGFSVTPLDVTLEQSSTQSDPDIGTPDVYFTATFSQAINTARFTCSDIFLGGAASGTCQSIVQIAPNDDTTFQVQVLALSDGQMTAIIPAGQVADTSGELNTISTSTDNSVDIDIYNRQFDVRINEVEYDALQSGTDDDYEWVELINTGTGVISLDNWTFGDDESSQVYTFPENTTIASGQTLVLVNTFSGFQTNYPAVSPDIVMSGALNLSNSGEPLSLKNGSTASGTLIDYVSYGNGDLSWNTLFVNNPGESICRKDVVDTDTVADWEVCTTPSPGAENTFNQIPTEISLSGSGTIDENSPIGTTIGTLTTSDADVSDIHTYTFVTGTGDTDNTSFTLSGAELVMNVSPDFEIQSSYSMRIQTDDSNGGTFQESFIVTVVDLDEVVPVITLTGSGNINILKNTTYTDDGATWTDNVDGSGSLVASGSVNTSFTGSYTLTYDYTDTAGNTATQVTRTVNVVTGNTPTITVTGSGIVTVEVGVTYTDLGATANDIEDGILTSSIVTTGLPISTTGTGSYTLIYNVTDSQDNAATSVTRTVNVVDTTLPAITLNGAAVVNLEVGDSYSDDGATWTDNLDGIGSIVATGGPVTTTGTGSFTLSYHYTDTAGNASATVTRTVNIVDTTIPVITLNGSGSITQEALLPYTDSGALWTDNVDGSGTLTASGTVITNISGTYPLYFNYTDSSGNPALQVIRNVTITSPTCNAGRELFTDTGGVMSCNACQEGYYNATPGGSCIPADAGYYVPNVESNTQLVCDPGTFTDSSGNNICTMCPVGYTSGTGATSCNDVEIPVITLNGSGSIDIEYGSTYTDLGAAWTDNAIGNNSGSLLASGSVDTNTLGVYTLTYDYTDGAGNAATQVTRTINVVDTTLPIIPTIPTLTSPTVIIPTNLSPLTGSGQIGTNITLKNVSGFIIGTGVVDSQGSFSITPSSIPTTGFIEIISSDISGNTASTFMNYDSIDRVPPIVSITSTLSPNIQGTGEVGTTIHIVTQTGITCTTTVSSSGVWNCILFPNPLPTGENFVLTNTDTAGNISSLTGTTLGGGGGSGGSPSSSSTIIITSEDASTTDDDLVGEASDQVQREDIEEISESDIGELSVDQTSVPDEFSFGEAPKTQTKTKQIEGKILVYTLENGYEQCSIIRKIASPDTEYVSQGIFSDEQKFLYPSEIQKFQSLGIVDGYVDGTFGPKKRITRAEFLKVVLISHCYDYQNQDISNLLYRDLEVNSWQARVVSRAQELSIINGDRDTQNNPIFRPDDFISKGEATKILMRMAMVQSLNPDTLQYNDVDIDWQKPYIITGQTLGLFDPEIDLSQFLPNNGVSREEMIHLINQLVQLY